MTSPVFQYEEKVDKSRAEQRLDTFLLDFPFDEFDEALSPSRTTIQKWIEDECVVVNNAVMTSKSYKVRPGDLIRLEVVIESEIETPPPEDLDIPVVYQDDHILVIDKPPGISSHPTLNAMTGSVVNFLYYKGISLPPTSHPLRPGIVHRLDKYTSGLMVIARTDQAMSRLIEMIKDRDIQRIYLALVFGSPPLDSGTVEKPIGRHPTYRKRMTVTRESAGKPAKTHFRVLTRYPGFSLVGCKLDTGRTHQIRVHMSNLGYPVAADQIYGGKKAADKVARTLKSMSKKDREFAKIEKVLERITAILESSNVHLLHATRLKFPHPDSGDLMSFASEPSGKFGKVLELLDTLPKEETSHALWD